MMNRREFLGTSLALAAAAQEPSTAFPTKPRQRLAVSTYPFRSLIGSGASKMSLAQFAQTIPDRFNVHGIEPWSHHFESTEPGYVRQLSASFKKAGVRVVNIPCDVRVQLCSGAEGRTAGLDLYHKWVEVAILLGSPSLRVHVPRENCAVDSLKSLAEYGAQKNIVINLENDDPRSENPYRVLKVIETVNSPYLRALPDFCNSRQLGDEAYNDKALAALFPHAYNISHVKDMETDHKGKVLRVNVDRIFAIAKHAGYRGYFSMEWEGIGDPYDGTRHLIEQSETALS
jgi:sugar phosphate isomerase/epimerase